MSEAGGEAGTLKCSSCGGHLPEGVPSCPFCAAVVESRRCLACFHLNLVHAVHCSACGRELGLDVVADPETLACPSCSFGGTTVHFTAVPAGEGTVHECPTCGGQFVDHATLRSLIEGRVQLEGAPPHSLRAATGVTGPVRYLPCPMCLARMNRKNFGERSGVILDVCKTHGSWFDLGELPRVLAFVDAGGLKEAERRVAERKAEERRKSAMAALSASIDPASSTHAPHDDSAAILDVLRHLLS